MITKPVQRQIVLGVFLFTATIAILSVLFLPAVLALTTSLLVTAGFGVLNINIGLAVITAIAIFSIIPSALTSFVMHWLNKDVAKNQPQPILPTDVNQHNMSDSNIGIILEENTKKIKADVRSQQQVTPAKSVEPQDKVLVASKAKFFEELQYNKSKFVSASSSASVTPASIFNKPTIREQAVSLQKQLCEQKSVSVSSIAPVPATVEKSGATESVAVTVAGMKKSLIEFEAHIIESQKHYGSDKSKENPYENQTEKNNTNQSVASPAEQLVGAFTQKNIQPFFFVEGTGSRIYNALSCFKGLSFEDIQKYKQNEEIQPLIVRITELNPLKILGDLEEVVRATELECHILLILGCYDITIDRRSDLYLFAVPSTVKKNQNINVAGFYGLIETAASVFGVAKAGATTKDAYKQFQHCHINDRLSKCEFHDLKTELVTQLLRHVETNKALNSALSKILRKGELGNPNRIVALGTELNKAITESVPGSIKKELTENLQLIERIVNLQKRIQGTSSQSSFSVSPAKQTNKLSSQSIFSASPLKNKPGVEKDSASASVTAQTENVPQEKRTNGLLPHRIPSASRLRNKSRVEERASASATANPGDTSRAEEDSESISSTAQMGTSL